MDAVYFAADESGGSPSADNLTEVKEPAVVALVACQFVTRSCLDIAAFGETAFPQTGQFSYFEMLIVVRFRRSG